MRLLGNGGESVIPFDHPRVGELYRSEVKKLVTAPRINPKAIETRVAFRNLIDCIVVHPGRKRMPHEYTPYLNSAAFSGMKLFLENRRKAAEIGIFASDGKSESVNAGMTISQQDSVISLGRWRATA